MTDDERFEDDGTLRAIDALAATAENADADDADEYVLNDIGLALRIRSGRS